MRLYRQLTANDWMKNLQLTIDELPQTMIVHGEWEHKLNLDTWNNILQEPKHTPKWNTIVGQLNGTGIGFANVYGAPMTANIVHQFACAGTKRFIQTGYFGGIKKGLKYGSILIVSAAKMKDGVSQFYSNEQEVAESSPFLVEKAIEYCKHYQIDYTVGNIVSVPSLLVETEEDIIKWIKDGFVGIDMETAATLSIALSYGKEAIGLLNLSDLIIEGDNLYEYTNERIQLEATTDEKIRLLATYLAQV